MAFSCLKGASERSRRIPLHPGSGPDDERIWMKVLAPAALALLLGLTAGAQAETRDHSVREQTPIAKTKDGARNFAATAGRRHAGFGQQSRARRASVASKVASRPKGGSKARMAMRRAKYIPIARKVKPASLPIALVDAVITKESRYVPTVRGSHGEVGLMQIRPSTARQLARQHGMDEVAGLSSASLVKWLHEPRNNIRLGTLYLKMCHDKAKGQVAATIGCYNAGPGNMWRWKGIKITRNYVSFVNKHMATATN